MGLLDKINKFFENSVAYTEQGQIPATSPEPEVVAPKAKKPRKPKAKPEPLFVADHEAERKAAEKALATAAGEPWVDVVQVVLDPANIGNGSFELDWNEIFVAKLVRAGYKGKNDRELVEQWFTDVCKNVVLETYEQAAADPTNPEHRSNQGPVVRRPLPDGRTEVS